MFMFCFFLQSGWNTAVAEQDVWNMLKVNLPLRFVLFFGEAPSRRMGALGEKKDRKNDRLIEGYKPPGNEWLSRDESSIRFPVVMSFKNNITLLACVQPQLGCNCTRATLYDLNQREAVNRKNLTAYRTKMKLHCREGSVFLFWRKSNLSDGEEKLSDFFGQFAPRGHWSRGVSSRDWAIKHLIGARRRVDFTTLTLSQAFVTRDESLRTTASKPTVVVEFLDTVFAFSLLLMLF